MTTEEIASRIIKTLVEETSHLSAETVKDVLDYLIDDFEMRKDTLP